MGRRRGFEDERKGGGEVNGEVGDGVVSLVWARFEETSQRKVRGEGILEDSEQC